MTISNNFFSDPLVIQYMEKLINLYKKYQKPISNVKPANTEFKLSYQKLIASIEKSRGQGLWYPYLSSGMGQGAFVELQDGSVKLDFISGIGVHWGHGISDLIEASLKGALQDTIMQGNLQQHAGSVELYELFCEASGFDLCFLTSSGAMALENGLKIAFQYRAPAKRLLAFEKCFSGRTVAVASITDKPHYREGLPIVLDVDYIPFFDSKDPEGSTNRAIHQLTYLLKKYPGQYACMIFELIQGEGGFNVGTRHFFKSLMTVLKNNNVLIFVDEIQTFGRTTELFAYQMLGLESFIDIVTVGKLSQVCATLYTSKIKPKPGLISQTFTSSTVAIETSKFILKSLMTSQYMGKHGCVARLHGYLARQFRSLQAEFPDILEGPFGVGSMFAFVVFNGEKDRVMSFVKTCFEKGLICFVAGNNPIKIRFLLPIGGVTLKDIDIAISIIKESILELT